MEQKYSDWFKIDLHIHTDKSKETKEGDYQGTFSVDTLKTKLKENEVRIFSLTDHNIVNVEAYREYYSKYDDKEDPLLLLGIELDIQGSSKKYHSLLVFNHDDIDSVENISLRLENKYSEKGIVDAKQRVLDISDIVQIFEKEDFFFIPHAGDAHKNIVSGNRNSIPETQRMLILMQSALEKVTKEEIIEHYNRGFDMMLSDDFQGKNDIAYINFSDNHCCDKYPKSHFGENDFSLYYIKGIKSFESIRLAFIDPESRIKSPEEFQKIDKTNNVVEKIKIEHNNGLAANELYFSPHLNAIIGGRSSGKSLLMWMMGNKIDGANISDNKKYDIDLDKVKLKTRNDIEEKGIVSLGNSYLYLEQGDIIRYFEEKKLNELATKAGKKEEYDSARKELTNKKLELDAIVNSLIDIYKKSYECNTNQFVLHKRIIDNVTSNENCVITFKSSRLETSPIGYEEALTLLNETLNKINAIKTHPLLEITATESEVLNHTEAVIKEKKDLINKKLIIIKRKNCFIDFVNGIVSDTNATLDENAKQKVADRKSIESIIDSVGTKMFLMRELKKKTVDIENFKFDDKRIIPIDDISLVVSIRSDLLINDLLIDGINNGDIKKSLFLNLCDLLNDKQRDVILKNFKDKSPVNLKKKVNNQLSYIYQDIENPVDYLAYSDGTDSFGKSPGYNSEQYIKIVLNNPELKVVFIDQPEDNLGNQFISKELVKQIRDIKYKKQIFLVTHNPSIVIYGDAECIILAENNQNTITYKQLFLEEKDSQEIICNVLDGGRYIFNNRAKKYNIHRLK